MNLEWSSLTVLFLFLFQLSYGAREALYDKLFINYNKYLRPVKSLNSLTEVTVDLNLISIIETNMADAELTYSQWFRMFWLDEKLAWNESEYNWISSIKVPKNHLWIPDISIYNLISTVDLKKDEDLYISINSTGFVSITMPQIVLIDCIFDVNDFPFDFQSCGIHLGPYVFDSTEIELYPRYPVETNYYETNQEWILLGFTVNKTYSMYSESPNPFATLYYTIRIQRNPEYYILIFFLPIFIITTLSIIGLYSPYNNYSERVEKVTMGLTTLLSMVVILLMISELMPKISTKNIMPLLGRYMMLEFVLSAIATLVSVLVLHLHRRQLRKIPVPHWLLSLLHIKTNKIRRIEPRRPHAHLEMVNTQPEASNPFNRSMFECIQMLISIVHRIEDRILPIEKLNLWSDVCSRLDCILMLIFIIVNILLSMFYLNSGYTLRREHIMECIP